MVFCTVRVLIDIHRTALAISIGAIGAITTTIEAIDIFALVVLHVDSDRYILAAGFWSNFMAQSFMRLHAIR